MKHPLLALARVRYHALLSVTRRKYFKLLGLNIDRGGLLGKITCEWPRKVSIGRECVIQDGVDFKIEHPFLDETGIKIGNRVFIGRCCEFNCTSKIVIGNNCMIGSNTTFADVSHEGRRKNITLNMQPVVSKEIIIGDDVGIGTGCIILKGVTIGNGSVVGAGSLVRKSIPEYEIWSGSPARFICKRK